MSAAVRSALASAPAVTARTLSQISTGSCSTQPAFGKICWCSFWSTETTRPSWLKIMHLDDVVPWSIAATYCSLIWLQTLSSLARNIGVRFTGGKIQASTGPGEDRLDRLDQ